jgi:hypothetical protein
MKYKVVVVFLTTNKLSQVRGPAVVTVVISETVQRFVVGYCDCNQSIPVVVDQ